jgi:hypothetical protein
MYELYGISYVFIRHLSRQRCFLFFKFIIDGLFMVRGTAPVPSPPAKPRGRPAKEAPVDIEAMSARERKRADKAKEQREKQPARQREKQKAVQRTVDNAAQEAVAAAREAQAREELEGMEESVNDITLDPSPPPSPGPRRNAAERQKVQNDTEGAKERERLAVEVEQLKSQLEKEKERRLSQSVAEPTAKKPKPSAAASRKKVVVIDDYIITTKLFDSLFVHRLHQCAQMPDQCEMH